MVSKYYSMALIGLMFGSITTLAMEYVPPSPRKKVPVPVLKADYTPAEDQRLRDIVDAYNRATGADIVFVSKETGVPIKMVAATLDMQLFLPFAAKLTQESEDAHAILRAIRENNPQEPVNKILQRILIELNKTYLFKGANDYHVAVLISDDQAIHDWLKQRIQDPKRKQKELQGALEELTDNAYHVSPLFLASLLDKQDLVELFKKREVELEKPFRFHAKLLAIAAESRKPEKKWIPSRRYREIMMESREQEKYRKQLIMLLKNIQFDPEFRDKLKKEDIGFYNWLIKKQQEFAKPESTVQQ